MSSSVSSPLGPSQIRMMDHERAAEQALTTSRSLSDMPTSIETERLSLNQFDISKDGESVRALLSDDKSETFFTPAWRPTGEDLDMVLKRWNENLGGDTVTYSVRTKETDPKVVGLIQIGQEGKTQADVSYCVDHEQGGQGFATEAMTGLLDAYKSVEPTEESLRVLRFTIPTDCDLSKDKIPHTVIGWTRDDNLASQNVLSKLGFQKSVPAWCGPQGEPTVQGTYWTLTPDVSER